MSDITLKISRQDARDLKEHLYHNFNNVSAEFRKQLDDKIARLWDENHDQNAWCTCGHIYNRHFDGYDDMASVGCKYCECYAFKSEE